MKATRCIPLLFLPLFTSLLLSLAALLSAREIPDQLPKPDGKAADSSKPVKVYILAGQSNMVGMGTINPSSQTAYKTYVSAEAKAKKGATLSIYKGKFDPSVDYSKEQAVETHHVMLGYWPHTKFPTIEGDFAQVVRGFIHIDRPGQYAFASVGGESILSVGGEEVYRKEPDAEALEKFVHLEKGVYPIEVAYFGEGASNLTYRWKDTPGTLTTLVKEQGKFPHLLGEDGEWSVRNDVIYEGLVSAKGRGPLSPTVGGGSTFGPELGFGHVMGYYHDEPVLVIKTSQGNRSLAWDFLPPGSERFTIDGTTYAGYLDPQPKWPANETPKPGNWNAGKQYDECFGGAKNVLKDFDKLYPQYAAQGYTIAGFAWWQGHKDSGDKVHAAKYEENLARLIQQLRREFEAPGAPFVVATIGFHGEGMPAQYKPVFDAQLAISDAARHPEFKGNVVSVDTRPFWRDASMSPQSQDYHYNRNAETYYLVGEAIGRAMARLKDGK